MSDAVQTLQPTVLPPLRSGNTAAEFWRWAANETEFQRIEASSA